MIGTIMRVAEKVCSETGCSMEEAIRRAVAAHNTVEDAPWIHTVAMGIWKTTQLAWELMASGV